jgi:hypothetical protein
MKTYANPRKGVKVYFNLHKKLFSVVSLEGEDRGLVIDHTSSISLVDCRLVVQPAGNKRVRKERKKNVHAYIAGHMVDEREMEEYVENTDSFCFDVAYNPYRHESFVMIPCNLIGEFPITRAEACRFHVLSSGKPEVWAYGGEA